jgi:hypothetical protein
LFTAAFAPLIDYCKLGFLQVPKLARLGNAARRLA